MSLKKTLRMLAVGIAVAGCVLVIPSYLGTNDDACADPGGCPHSCPHTACVTLGCGEDGVVPTEACTYAAFQGPKLIECDLPCRNLPCQ